MLRRHRHGRPVEQLRNSQYLDARIVLAPTGRVVYAGADGLGAHIARRLLQRHEHANRRLLALDGPYQVADVAALDVARFHLHPHPAGTLGAGGAQAVAGSAGEARVGREGVGILDRLQAQ